LEVISQGWILVISNSLKLFIGIKTKYQTKAIVSKAKDRIDKGEHVHPRISCQVAPLLYGCQEVHHKINCKENADEDIDHNHLVADLSLHHVEYKKEKYTKDGLT